MAKAKTVTEAIAEDIIELIGLAQNEVDSEILFDFVETSYDSILDEIKQHLKAKGIKVLD